MSYLEKDGVRLRDPSPIVVETRCGPIECVVFGAGPAILALHGGMGGYDQGVLLAQAALGDLPVQIVAPSRPGYLGTPLSVGRSPEDHADACAALLDALEIERAAVIAVSAGGLCALQFALRHPNRCRALILISACSGRLKFPRRLFVPLFVMKLTARIPALAELMRRHAESSPERAARRSIPDPDLRRRTFSHPQAGPLMRALSRSTMDRVSRRLPGTLNDIRRLEEISPYPLRAIAAPALVVHGVADRTVPFAHAEAVAEQVASAEVLPIVGGGHVCLFTHLDDIRRTVGDFLFRHSDG